MGGSIRIVTNIDSIITKQTRWTNSLPCLVKNKLFLECDRNYINEYLVKDSEYREVHETFSPCSYGLDFFDFDRKKIYTNQGYCSYITISSVELFTWLKGMVADFKISDNGAPKIIPATSEDVGFYPTEVKKMWEADMISCSVFIGGKKKLDKYYLPENIKLLNKSQMNNISFESCLAYMEKFEYETLSNRFGLRFKGKKEFLFEFFLEEEINHRIVGFHIDWEKFGWELKEYEEDKEGFMLMLSDIQKENTLTTEDLEGWNDFLTDRYSEN